ncbi:tryptophan 2,3-dioxygenase [Ginsengibacter hankyongi]|uniref:Tryptophan 2,3-dioxygenase n=1 Tax=Ginsengibacter hankyongi TaxID=2607284 RepID=A0A5J5IKV9_9BACT|nr:tryptophan 2,3-dioxygenase family protein [Ginsengibacter hankyongi]KAA9040707.1 tryptophan 2,3-dioxygenase [Ginsengibacter hankyongi]
MAENKSMYYTDYLQLDKILDAQHPESFKHGNEPAHDEMLFIIIHQAYELWFKQILFELDFILQVFKKEKIDDNSEDLNLVRHRLNRVIKILELLTQQITLLETMTPLDFLEFRNLLIPASGFQSVQFRLIEATLGLQMDHRFNKTYYKRTNEGGFDEKDFNKINETENAISLLSLINKWLERMPFFEIDLWKNYHHQYPPSDSFHPFWSDYRNIYKNGLNEREANRINDFDFIFFEDKNAISDGQSIEKPMLSAKALRAALFIMLYRDFPVFQTSYQILDALIETDHQMANWRHKHIDMVRRMIGMRMGTGNTSGRGYLEGALNSHYIFKDIAGLSTFLIERKNLPKLPVELIKKLSYNN